MRGLKNRSVSMLIASLVMASSLGVAGAAPASVEVGFAPRLTAAPASATKFVAAAKRPAVRKTAVAKKQVAIATVTRKSVAKVVRPATAKRAAVGEEAQAKLILRRYIAKYPILKGTTISFGDTRGYQAIAYYQSGRIIVSKSHTASLERIIGHEIWHVIDYRDNGRIDWGENVPPKNY